MQNKAEIKTKYFIYAESGNLQELSQILERNPDLLNQRDENNQSALFHAIFGGNYQCVAFLLSKGIDILSTDYRGWTALHEATFNGTPEMIKLLLSHGALVNAKSNDGVTSLHIATQDGWPEVVEILLENNADPSMTDNQGNNAYDRARNVHNEKQIRELLNKYQAHHT
jgi:ankyrin repeat protein